MYFGGLVTEDEPLEVEESRRIQAGANALSRMVEGDITELNNFNRVERQHSESVCDYMVSDNYRRKEGE